MGKIVAAINMTIDGFCDHEGMSPDEQIHDHYKKLLDDCEVVLYGRKTFGLMEYWRPFVEHPTGEKSMDEFAATMDKTPKIVFSKTMQNSDWKSASLADESLEKTVSELKQKPSKDVLVCSRSLIVQLTNLDLIDEFQLCVHPVIVGKGLPLFDEINDRTVFELLKSHTFDSGAILLFYKRKASEKT
ncbi:dihydrofolate reductase family protein [Flavobacterium sp.]|uniref:dihydrofolate reductase family protein n=1 Tax=Flavobacterium sp. TaxID=239 RepID=UPI0011FFACB8|nr:dihydrofolate reductase family protein [Flavobacterium sp.]RZJ73599.1 MAG: dihydrofolate reductase [Flavobacterium sp.]